MGSRADRARRGIPQPPRREQTTNATPVTVASLVEPPVPDVTGLDLAFGNIKHMPRYETVPDEFKVWRGNPYVDLVSKWFFDGLKRDDIARLVPRPGVEKGRALAAIRAIICSFEPQHEHKEAGAAYLLSCWFELDTKVRA